jgi:ABC transporter substrate binding protein
MRVGLSSRRIFTEVGGLLSYGIDQLDSYRQAATYADRILKGEKPSELPIQAPVRRQVSVSYPASGSDHHSARVPVRQRQSAANKFHHSITWSARAKSVGGIVNPSALAVFRLMTSSRSLSK